MRRLLALLPLALLLAACGGGYGGGSKSSAGSGGAVLRTIQVSEKEFSIALPSTTLGYERLFNWAFQVNDEDEFVQTVLTDQPEPPRYFARMKFLNRDGPPPAVTGPR